MILETKVAATLKGMKQPAFFFGVLPQVTGVEWNIRFEGGCFQLCSPTGGTQDPFQVFSFEHGSIMGCCTKKQTGVRHRDIGGVEFVHHEVTQ